MNQRPRKVTCPNCQGKGCPLCQGKGTLYLTPQQLQRVKTVLQKMPKRQIQTQPQSINMPMPKQQAPPGLRPLQQQSSKLAGVITLIVFILIGAGSLGSWFYFKSLKPFLAGLIDLSLIGLAGFLWNSKYIRPKPPDDFLTALDKQDQPDEKQKQNPPFLPY